MFEIKEKPKMVERALLVGAYTRDEERAEADSLLEELAELVHTLGIPIVGRELVHHCGNLTWPLKGRTSTT
jgi:GTP-binding protein HflX